MNPPATSTPTPRTKSSTLLRAEIKSTGAAAIMVTHSTAAAASADRILILSDGGLHGAKQAERFARTANE